MAKTLPRKEQARPIIQRLGVRRIGSTGKNRHLGEDFPRSEDVQDVLLAGKRRLIDADPAARHGKKSPTGVAGEKNILPPGVDVHFGDTGQSGQLAGGKPGKKPDAGDCGGDVHVFFRQLREARTLPWTCRGE